MSFRATAFVALGRVSSRLPPVRGRTRVFLELHRLLGLKGKHVPVRCRLRRPVEFEVQLDLNSWLQRIAFLTGAYEDDTVRFLVELHRRQGGAGCLLDVGANIGLISIPFAKLTGARVVAVEAVADNARSLATNIELNGMAGAIQVIPYGLGDEPKAAQVHMEGGMRSGEGSGSASILPDGCTYDCVRQEIRIETLDALQARGSIPAGCSVMKIDVEGYELKVLYGGTDFLRRERPVIFGEFSAHCMNWHGQSVRDVVDFARAHDYEVWRRLLPDWKFSVRAIDPTFDIDLLLVPAERRGEFASLQERQ